MGATERIVRHLRLRAESEADVRRAALKLEDALRCASLPDAGARLLLVRRLDLGLIAARASPQTLSLLLERRVAAAGGSWVHGAGPNADRAGCVFFRDALEARCELALRLAQTAPCTAWYWPLAVPEFEPADDALTNLRRIALAIAELPEAPAALPAWVARLAAAGAAPVLARAIEPAQAARLLRAARLSVDTLRAQAIRMAPAEAPPLAPNAQRVDRAQGSPRRELAVAFTALPSWVQTLAGAGGLVASVLSAMSVAASTPAAPAAPTARAAALPGASQGGGRQPSAEVETPSVLVASDTGAKDRLESPPPRQIKTDTAHLAGEADGVTTAAAPGPPLAGGHGFRSAAPSAFGGLLFLLPVLQRLGYPAWAEGLPEGAAAHIAQQMLAVVLRRLQAPPDDPAWLLAGASCDDDFAVIDVKAPASWGDPALAVRRGAAAKDVVVLAQQARSGAALARVWLIACRRWLRRVAGIGVASLVTRPGAIGLSATHADVFFRLSDADMRVRRAGLDFDLGWLPWMGRVVTFHYDHEERS